MEKVSKTRFAIGTSVFVLGFASPLFIPFVTSSSLSVAWKSGLSGFLALGIPEIFMLIAIAIMGKSGYEFLKAKLGRFIKPLLPSDKVSLLRYRIGLILFCTPLLAGWVLPYLRPHLSFLTNLSVWYYILGDIIFVISLFVLGGDFWDKLRSLFNHKARLAVEG